VATKQRILLMSRSAEAARSIERLLELERALSIETRILEGRQTEPLHGVPAADLVLFHAGSGAMPELEALAARPAAERVPLVVIGDTKDAEGMRAAMRAGARDFLPEPVSEEDLKASIGPILAERAAPESRRNSEMTAFVNAKGGSGATFIACNVAHLLADMSELDTVLVDLDFQFGALPRYFDLEPKRSLLEALDVANDLDSAAIDAYLTRHESGLSVFSSTADDVGAPQIDVMTMADRFETVLALLGTSFERVVVDVPRNIESCAAAVLERADTVVLVLQQSIPSLHDATRMYEFLARSLAVPPNRIVGVVNRYHKAAAVELADIEHALGISQLICVPNDFRAVAESINVGVPMRQHAKRSPVTRALISIAKRLDGRETAVSKRLIPLLRKTG
jgi:pilus assembly protein CpaE